MFHPDSRELLGVPIAGPGATELMHIGQPVLAYQGTIDEFVQNVFHHPTLAEWYRTAVLDGLNRLTPTTQTSLPWQGLDPDLLRKSRTRQPALRPCARGLAPGRKQALTER